MASKTAKNSNYRTNVQALDPENRTRQNWENARGPQFREAVGFLHFLEAGRR